MACLLHEHPSGTTNMDIMTAARGHVEKDKECWKTNVK
jgi:hypothetical protein